MRSVIPLLAAAASLVAAQAPAAYTPTPNDEIYAQIKSLPLQTERIKVLANDSEFVFNFLDPTAERTKGAGGFIVLANAGTFPALYSHGMAMALGVLGPCTINSPHTHPRATEFNVALNGTLHTGMLAENNARFVVNDVGVLSATFFPKGSVHFEANLGCDPVYFIAAFSDEDPGVLQVAQRFFGLPPDIVGDAMGGLGVEQVAGLASLIPDNIIFAGDDCFQRCGLTKPPQPTAQQQPRVSGNALPSSTASVFIGSSGPVPSAMAPAPAPASAPPAMAPAPMAPAASAPPAAGGAAGYPYPAGANSGSGSSGSGGALAPYPGYNPGATNAAAVGGHPVVALADPTTGDSSSSDSTLKTLIIAVLAINGVLVLGILGGLAFLVFRRRHDQPGSQRLMGMAPGPRGSYMRTSGKGDEVVFSMPDTDAAAGVEHKDGPPSAAGGWYSDPYAGDSRTSLDRTTMPPREDAPQRGRASY